MAGKKDEFDFLTFFIYVMLLLTVIVGGFAALNQRKVNDVSKKIKREVRFLEEMGRLAMDEEFRALITKDREGSSGVTGGTVSDFQGLCIKFSRDPQHPLRLENQSLQGEIPHPGGIELPVQLVIKQCRVEHLIKFLVKIEETWPGAQVKKITKLQYTERKEKKGWDATIIVSIFKANP